jgi:2,3-bisphosphoglycerate-independent phosphoglycerate mutase
MIGFPYLANVVTTSPSKIVMLVVDGLGGLAHAKTGRSELETAHLPNLDQLAKQSACGLTVPVTPGISPGSGPGHLALFGYDPIRSLIGRGALEALGIDIELGDRDIAARGNFCSIDADGNLTDRRAGRIPTELAAPLVELLDGIDIPGAETAVFAVKDYRFVLRIRGDGLEDGISETDPERLGVPPLDPMAQNESSQKSARIIRDFTDRARFVLRDRSFANMVLLRGFSKMPALPQMGDAYLLKPAAIAAYPMYRGLARMLGMEIIDAGNDFGQEVEALHRHYSGHDFFYLHYKPADAAGEDGDFEGKVAALEALDTFIPSILELNPEVFIVAGDHATPSILASHSWHPVPLLLRSQWTAGEGIPLFHERTCASGSLGTIQASQIMLLAMAHAGKLRKYGP